MTDVTVQANPDIYLKLLPVVDCHLHDLSDVLRFVGVYVDDGRLDRLSHVSRV